MLAQNEHSSNPPQVQDVHLIQPQPCVRCKKLVYWLYNAQTRKWSAIDEQHSHIGTALVNRTDGTYRTPGTLERASILGWLHTIHSETCTKPAQTGLW